MTARANGAYAAAGRLRSGRQVVGHGEPEYCRCRPGPRRQDSARERRRLYVTLVCADLRVAETQLFDLKRTGSEVSALTNVERARATSPASSRSVILARIPLIVVARTLWASSSPWQ